MAVTGAVTWLSPTVSGACTADRAGVAPALGEGVLAAGEQVASTNTSPRTRSSTYESSDRFHLDLREGEIAIVPAMLSWQRGLVVTSL
jgi:hypothetical protein